jgi:hypothetical protein
MRQEVFSPAAAIYLYHMACRAFSLSLYDYDDILWNEHKSNGGTKGHVHLDYPIVTEQEAQEDDTADSMQNPFASRSRVVWRYTLPHRGYDYADMSKGGPEVLGRFNEQIDHTGALMNLEQRRHSSHLDQWMLLCIMHELIIAYIAVEKYKNIATPLIKKGQKGERRPKLI